MIQYENISIEDMRNYWGDGVVLVPHVNKDLVYYNAYAANIGKNEVLLKLVDKYGAFGSPQKQILWNYDQFFRNAMLHRPHLGVVVDAGEVYSLGWQHANGMNQGKALLFKDIHVITVRKSKIKENHGPVKKHWGMHWTTLYQDRIRELEGGLFDMHPNVGVRLKVFRGTYENRLWMHPQSRQPDAPEVRMDEGVHLDSLSLAIKYLNQRSVRLRELLDRDDGVYFVGDTVWADKAGRKITLHNASMVLGSVSENGEFICAQTHPIVSLACTRLATQLIKE